MIHGMRLYLNVVIMYHHIVPRFLDQRKLKLYIRFCQICLDPKHVLRIYFWLFAFDFVNTVYYIYLVLFKIAELDVAEMMYGMKDAAPLLLSLLLALTSPAAAKEQVSSSSSTEHSLLNKMELDHSEGL